MEGWNQETPPTLCFYGPALSDPVQAQTKEGWQPASGIALCWISYGMTPSGNNNIHIAKPKYYALLLLLMQGWQHPCPIQHNSLLVHVAQPQILGTNGLVAFVVVVTLVKIDSFLFVRITHEEIAHRCKNERNEKFGQLLTRYLRGSIFEALHRCLN